MKRIDIEVLGNGFYSIFPVSHAGVEWMRDNVPDADTDGCAYSDSTPYTMDIADGAINDGLAVNVNNRAYLGNNRIQSA